MLVLVASSLSWAYVRFVIGLGVSVSLNSRGRERGLPGIHFIQRFHFKGRSLPA